MEREGLTPTIAVDFDGTLCEEKWPDIGKANNRLISFLIGWREKGNKVILWTCRENAMLQAAVDWCARHDLYFDAVNRNLPERIKAYHNDSRKVGADYYIDDLCTYVIDDNTGLFVSPPRKELRLSE